MVHPDGLQRFLTTQDGIDPLAGIPVYDVAVAELRAGCKKSHWMWFVFPQLKGLARSLRSEYYGIASRDEAVDYLAHDVLGPRLRRCARLVANSTTTSAEALMGVIDELKLQSCMTLFAEVAVDGTDFVTVLDRFYEGERDTGTLRLLENL